jgi:tetratricopeptide (TPR) repeat protein
MSFARTLFAFACLVAAARSASAQDKIIWKGERAPTEGSVVSLTFREIKYRLPGAGSEQEDLAKDVKDIEFDRDNTIIPYEYNHGINALHKGQFKEAVQQFDKAIDMIKKSNSPNHPVRDFCRKYIMEAHRGEGNAQALVDAARALRKEKPDSFFLRDSFLMQYDAAKMRRDTALLNETIRELDEVIRSDRRYQDLERDASILRADVAETNKKYSEALDMYKRLSGDRELWEQVSLGMLRCLQALGRTAELKAKVESLLTEIREKRESSPRVYLGAILARGDVFRAEGKLKEALLDYMKGALDPGQAANTFEHESALAKAAIAAAAYGKQFGEKDKTNKTLYIDRAKEMREELKRTFPSTTLMPEVEAAINDANRAQ